MMQTVTVEGVLRKELSLRGVKLEDLAREVCLSPSALVARLQGGGFVPPDVRLELSELLGVPLPIVSA